jgi:hypothetical protein
MAKVEMKILLDSSRPREEGFLAGESLQGKVEVKVLENLSCKGLTISLLWEIEGKGNSTQGERAKSTLYQGEWLEGEVHVYPFSLEIPKGGPFPYQGENFRLEYFLKAEADIPLAFNPVEKLKINVQPSTEAGIRYVPGDGFFNLVSAGEVNEIDLGCGLLVSACFGLFIFVMLAASKNGNREVALFTGVFAFIIVFFGITNVRNVLARFRIYKPIFEIQNNVFMPGQAIPFGLSVTAKSTFTFNEVTVSIIVEEETTKGSGKNSTTLKHKVFEVVESYLKGETVTPGEPRTLMETIMVPPDTPFFLEASSNRVTCTLKAYFDIPQCPDYTVSKPIYLIPPGYQLTKS